MHVAVDIFHDANALRNRAGAVARQRDEFDFGRKAAVMQRADKIGRENERSLEHGNDQQILGRAAGNVLGHVAIALGDLLGGIKRLDIFSTDDGHSYSCAAPCRFYLSVKIEDRR
ncbi:hypothetical protein D3C86_1564340 [compost metagenome]